MIRSDVTRVTRVVWRSQHVATSTLSQYGHFLNTTSNNDAVLINLNIVLHFSSNKSIDNVVAFVLLHGGIFVLKSYMFQDAIAVQGALLSVRICS